MPSLFVFYSSLSCFNVCFLRFRFCFFCCQCVCCRVGEEVCFVSRTAFVCILLFSLTLLRCVLCQEWFLFVVLLFFRFCYGVFRSKNGSRVLFCSLFDSVGVVLGLRLLSFLCLFWLCFARVSRSFDKNGLKIFECFAFCLIWYKRLSCVCFVLIFVFVCLLWFLT